MHPATHQFAQAMANGEITTADKAYVLEHIDGTLPANVALWMSRTFADIAEELLKAENLAVPEEPWMQPRRGHVVTTPNAPGVRLD